MNKYKLILCELHHPFIHGKTDDSDPYIETHFIVISEYNIIDIDIQSKR